MTALIWWKPYIYLAVCLAFVLLVSWLATGKRIVTPPTSENTVMVFSSRFLCLFQSLFLGLFGLAFLLMGADFLFFETDKNIGGTLMRFGVGFGVLLCGSAILIAAKIFATRLIVPDYVKVSDDGVESRSAGRVRSWQWSNIADAYLNSLPDRGPVMLVLKEGDADRARLKARLGWFGQRIDPHIVPIGFFLRPTALLETGPQTIRNAIKNKLAGLPRTFARPLS